MAKYGTRVVETRIVLSSQAACNVLEGASIVLETTTGAIAFVVDQRAIDALRRDLSAAEAFLRQRAGSS